MKKYLCLVYFEAKHLMALSRQERVVLDRDSLAYDKELESGGHFVAAEALQSPQRSRTVSVRQGKRLVIDGPFAETKEQLGGFILIQAKNMAQAVKLGAGIPLAKLGRIEVRPIYHIPVR
jgi:hypothetical protein